MKRNSESLTVCSVLIEKLPENQMRKITTRGYIRVEKNKMEDSNRETKQRRITKNMRKNELLQKEETLKHKKILNNNNDNSVTINHNHDVCKIQKTNTTNKIRIINQGNNQYIIKNWLTPTPRNNEESKSNCSSKRNIIMNNNCTPIFKKHNIGCSDQLVAHQNGCSPEYIDSLNNKNYYSSAVKKKFGLHENTNRCHNGKNYDMVPDVALQVPNGHASLTSEPHKERNVNDINFKSDKKSNDKESVVEKITNENNNIDCISIKGLGEINLIAIENVSMYFDLPMKLKMQYMSEILHLCINDLRKQELSVDNAIVLNSPLVAEKEIIRAEQDYKYITKHRSNNFVQVFIDCIKTFCGRGDLFNFKNMYLRELILVVYCNIINNVVIIKKDNIEYCYTSQNIIKTLLDTQRYKINESLSSIKVTSEIVFKLFTLERKIFKSCVDVVGEVLNFPFYNEINENIYNNNNNNEIRSDFSNMRSNLKSLIKKKEEIAVSRENDSSENSDIASVIDDAKKQNDAICSINTKNKTDINNIVKQLNSNTHQSLCKNTIININQEFSNNNKIQNSPISQVTASKKTVKKEIGTLEKSNECDVSLLKDDTKITKCGNVTNDGNNSSKVISNGSNPVEITGIISSDIASRNTSNISVNNNSNITIFNGNKSYNGLSKIVTQMKMYIADNKNVVLKKQTIKLSKEYCKSMIESFNHNKTNHQNCSNNDKKCFNSVDNDNNNSTEGSKETEHFQINMIKNNTKAQTKCEKRRIYVISKRPLPNLKNELINKGYNNIDTITQCVLVPDEKQNTNKTLIDYVINDKSGKNDRTSEINVQSNNESSIQQTVIVNNSNNHCYDAQCDNKTKIISSENLSVNICECFEKEKDNIKNCNVHCNNNSISCDTIKSDAELNFTENCKLFKKNSSQNTNNEENVIYEKSKIIETNISKEENNDNIIIKDMKDTKTEIIKECLVQPKLIPLDCELFRIRHKIKKENKMKCH